MATIAIYTLLWAVSASQSNDLMIGLVLRFRCAFEGVYASMLGMTACHYHVGSLCARLEARHQSDYGRATKATYLSRFDVEIK